MLLVSPKRKKRNLSSALDSVIYSCKLAQNERKEYIKKVRLTSSRKIRECRHSIQSTYHNLEVKKRNNADDFFTERRSNSRFANPRKELHIKKRRISIDPNWRHTVNDTKRGFGCRWTDSGSGNSIEVYNHNPISFQRASSGGRGSTIAIKVLVDPEH